MAAKKDEFTEIVDIYFDFEGTLLIAGTVEMVVPSHAKRIEITRKEQEDNLSENELEAADYFYNLVEESLRSADLRIYQLPAKYKLSDYKKSQDGLELIKHIVDYKQLGYYEFFSALCNKVIPIFGGVKLGKKPKKS